MPIAASPRLVDRSSDPLDSYYSEIGYARLSKEEQLALGKQYFQARSAVVAIAKQFQPFIRRQLFKSSFPSVSKPRSWKYPELVAACESMQDYLSKHRDLHPRCQKIIWQLVRRKKELHQARERLVTSFLRLSILLAKQFHCPTLPLFDRIQEANIALLVAVDEYDYRFKVPFKTFAYWRIRHALTLVLTEKSRVISIGWYAYRKSRKENDRLAATKGIVRYVVGPGLRSLSELVDPRLQDGDLTYGDIIPQDTLPSPQAFIDEDAFRYLKSRLQSELHLLDRRSRKVVCMYVGLGHRRPYTLAEIGKRLRDPLSGERVRQIWVMALKRLTRRMSCERSSWGVPRSAESSLSWIERNRG